MAFHTDKTYPSGFISRSEAALSSAPRANFIDYFPRTKENYKGFIAQNLFKEKIKDVIYQAVKLAGKLSTHFVKLPEHSNSTLNLIKMPAGKYVSKSGLSSEETKANLQGFQASLDKMSYESKIRNYYEDIKTDLLYRIWGKEWRQLNEMHSSEDMYLQSKNYFTSAVKDVGIHTISLGTGKAIGMVSKKLDVKTIRQFRDRLPNTGFSLTGKTQKMGNSTFNYSARMSFTTRNNSVTLAEFDILSQTIDKGLEKTTDIITDNSNFESFNCFDFGATSDCGKKLNTAVDIATNFSPHIAFAKLVVNTGYNTLLGFQTRKTAHRMKIIEEHSNEAERNFNQKLKQTIYDDVNALSYEDIKNLIEKLGLMGLTK